MGLADLPTELLHSIGRNIDIEEINDAKSLTYTCRRFHGIFQSLIYRYAVEHRCAAACHWTGKHGHIDILRCLIAEGGNKIIHDVDTTPLFAAAEYGQTEMIQFLIAHGVKLTMEREDDQYVFRNAPTLAAENGHKEIVRLLLHAGVDINWSGNGNITALTAAAVKGHNEVVMFLYERGADIAVKDGWRRTAFCSAAGHCGAAVVERMMERLPEEFLTELDDLHMTPLSFAAECGNLEVVKLLVNRGVDITGPDRGNTPLRMAIEATRIETVRFLLDAGACPNESQMPRQYAPLPLAADLGHDEIVRMLLEKGADVHYLLPWGEAPLAMAAARGHEAVVRRLVEAGASLEHGEASFTALDFALRNCEAGVAMLLLALGADPVPNDGGRGIPLLSLAVQRNDRDLVMKLLDADASVNIFDNFTVTPLMVAAMNDRADLARALMKKGADPHAKTSHGCTPLALAAERGYLDMVLALLDDGTAVESWTCRYHPIPEKEKARACPSGRHIRWGRRRAIDTPDSMGRTPLFYATVNGHQHVVAALLARGSNTIDRATNAGRTARSVADQWVLDPESTFAQRETVKAIRALFDDPTTATVSVAAVAESKLECSHFPAHIDNWDLRKRPPGEFDCWKCRALISEYGEHLFCPMCNDHCRSLCVECVPDEVYCLHKAYGLQSEAQWRTPKICKYRFPV